MTLVYVTVCSPVFTAGFLFIALAVLKLTVVDWPPVVSAVILGVYHLCPLVL